jgi:hypothetical protein
METRPVKGTALKPGDRILLAGNATLLVKEVKVIGQGAKGGECPRLIISDKYPQGTTAAPGTTFRVVLDPPEDLPEPGPPRPRNPPKLPKAMDPRDIEEQEATLLRRDEEKRGEKYS